MSLLSTNSSTERVRKFALDWEYYENDIEYEDYQEKNTMAVVDNWDKYRTKMENYITNNEFTLITDKNHRYTFGKIDSDNISSYYTSNELFTNVVGNYTVKELYLEYTMKGSIERRCGLEFNIVMYSPDDKFIRVLHQESYNFDCAKNMYKTMKKIIESE